MTLKPPKILLVTYKHNKGVKKGMMQKKGWWILVIVSVGIMIPFMIPYLTLNPANSRVLRQHNILYWLHISFAPLLP